MINSRAENDLDYVLSLWPDELDLSIKVYSEDPLRYAPVYVADVYHSIYDNWKDNKNGIIYSNINLSIYNAVHDVSKYTIKLKKEDIRREFLLEDIRHRLLEMVGDPDSILPSAEDMRLIKDYIA